LLEPAVALAEQSSLPAWVPVVIGFLLGALSIWWVDRLLPALGERIRHAEFKDKERWRRSFLLVCAIAMHNIPEGIAVGIVFGAAGAGIGTAGIASALVLTLAIALQNFPEGLAVSLPLHREGLSKKKSFFWGQLAGAVEPLTGWIGAVAIVMVEPLLPYGLSFAAGAMIFVVVKELIPESQQGRHASTATLGTMIGFAFMTGVEIALG
jgi:zinc transporter, ZIP family